MPEQQPLPAAARAGAELIEATCGVVIPEYRWPVVLTELHRLGSDAGAEGALARFTQGDPAIREALLGAVTIPETYLFRHPAHFRVLRRTAEERAGRGLATRVLSVGCSTGEEAWSAAAVLASVAPPAGLAHLVVGWDLSARRLEQARAATYGPWSARIGLLEYGRHFVCEGSTIRPAAGLSGLVSFSQVNLVAAPYGAHATFDAVLLRNVAIYWRPPTVAEVWRRLAELLDREGIFLVGPSDPVELPADAWEQVVEDGGRCYRRRTGRTPDSTDQKPAASMGGASEPHCATAAPGPTPMGLPPADAVHHAEPGRAPAAPTVGEPPPDAQGALLDEVRALADAGRYHEALKLLQEGAWTETVEGRRWCGILHLALEHLDDAIRLFRQCVFLDPHEPSHRRWLAAAYEAAGLRDDANREIRNFEEMAGP